ncbi:MAG: hypothetical protein WC473_03115 [Patescibacteria group bacterium]|jgi:Zn-dependent metalloprotease
MNKKIIAIVIILVMVVGVLFLTFQDNIKDILFKSNISLDNVSIEIIQPHANHKLSPTQLAKAKELFGKNNISEDFNEDLWIYNLIEGNNGDYIIKALQLYNGLTIFSSDLYYHFRENGNIRYLVGDVAHVDINSLEPKISPEEAILKIKRKHKLKLNDFNIELGLRDRYISMGENKQEYLLVWKITRNNKDNSIGLSGMFSEAIVDAVTGDILYYFDGVFN